MALQIAVKRREVKNKGEQERYKHLNTEFQRIARRDKKAFFSDQLPGASTGDPTHDKVMQDSRDSLGHPTRDKVMQKISKASGLDRPPGPSRASTPKPESVFSGLSPTPLTLTGGYP